MGGVVSSRPVEGEADPRVADMCAMLLDTLAEVRAGLVEGAAVMLVSSGGVQTRWCFTAADGHGHLLISAASRLVHDLNDTANRRAVQAGEDYGA